jgi:hypothetical protein
LTLPAAEFEGVVSADGETGIYRMELVDLENLVFRITEYEALVPEQ